METQWQKSSSRRGIQETIQQGSNASEQLALITDTLSEWIFAIISTSSLRPTREAAIMIISRYEKLREVQSW